MRLANTITNPPSEPSGYARLRPVAARAVLAGWVLFACFCLAKMPTPPTTCEAQEQSGNNGDVALYRAEIDWIRDGENYYAAAARELVVRGYPTRSVFNWRTPLPMWLIGKLPEPRLGKALLGLLALGLLLAAFAATSREEKNIFRGPLPLAALMCGAAAALPPGRPVRHAGALGGHFHRACRCAPTA